MKLSSLSTALAIVLACSTAATAIDFSKTLVDEDGKPLRVCVELKPETGAPHCAREVELTLARVARNALHFQFPDEQTLQGDERYKRGELAQRIVVGDVSLKAEDVALIKKLIGKKDSPAIVFQAWRELDPGVEKK